MRELELIAYIVDGNIIHSYCAEEYNAKDTSEFFPIYETDLDELCGNICIICDDGV